jgi:murein L,D-transpeptidase YafK
MKTRAFVLLLTLTASGTLLLARSSPRATSLRRGTSVDFILVDKSERTLRIFRKGRPLKTYRIALGRAPEGAKTEDGDGRTPEGRYRIESRNARSAYHLSLRVSYPTAAQRRAARRRGVSPGGDIMIHGLPNGFDSLDAALLPEDWTAGCIAVTNEEIEELWRVVPVGTVIEIRP